MSDPPPPEPSPVVPVVDEAETQPDLAASVYVPPQALPHPTRHRTFELATVQVQSRVDPSRHAPTIRVAPARRVALATDPSGLTAATPPVAAPPRRSWRWVPLGLAGLVLLAGAGVGWAFGRRPGTPQTAAATHRNASRVQAQESSGAALLGSSAAPDVHSASAPSVVPVAASETAPRSPASALPRATGSAPAGSAPAGARRRVSAMESDLWL